MRFPIAFKLTGLVLLSVLLVAGFQSYFLYVNGYQELEDKFGLTLEHIAQTAAVHIAGDDHEKIAGPGDEKKAEFSAVRDVLNKVMKSNGLAPEQIYTFRVLPDNPDPAARLHFGVMLQKKTFVGDPYDVPEKNRAVIERVLAGESARTLLYEDAHGTWVSGLAPIKNSAGRVSGILEVDFRVNRFIGELNQKITRVILQTALITTLALLVGVLFTYLITRPIARLKRASRSIELGNYDIELDVGSRDELEDLADSFKGMAVAVSDSRKKLYDYAQNLEEKVAERTRDLEQAKQETDRIMRTVQEGLFLLNNLDGKFILGGEYSAALENILRKKDLAGQDFLETLSSLVPGSVLKSARDYLELLFAGQVNRKMLEKLNPLNPVEITFPDLSFKNLQMEFESIPDAPEWTAMVTVRDVTREVTLNRQLEESELRARGQMQRLFSILHVDPAMLSEFIEESSRDMEDISNILENTRDPEYFREALNTIYRDVHSIKGNADMLGLDYLVEQAHLCEEKISEVIIKEDLSGVEILPVTMRLQEIQSALDETDRLVHRLLSFRRELSPDETGDAPALVRSVENIVRKTARKLNKQVEFVVRDFDREAIPAEPRRVLKKVLVQLARNSVAHGIEPPDERVARGKPAAGKIEVRLERTSGGTADRIELEFRDDGGGFPLEKLKEKLISSGKWPAEEIAAWEEGRLLKYLFTPGVSTAEHVDRDAGRGMGMDVIRQSVASLGGKLAVSHREKKFSRFFITLPIE